LVTVVLSCVVSAELPLVLTEHLQRGSFSRQLVKLKHNGTKRTCRTSFHCGVYLLIGGLLPVEKQLYPVNIQELLS